MKQITLKTEVRNRGTGQHRYNTGKYKVCLFGSSQNQGDTPYGEVWVPDTMLREKGFPTSITLNFEEVKES